jgi:hypothetical protein
VNKGTAFNPRKIALSPLGNNQAEGAVKAVVLSVVVNGLHTTISVAAITNASPVVVSAVNVFSNAQSIVFGVVPGITQLSNNRYYIGAVTSTSFALYLDAALTQPVNGVTMSPFVVNSVDSNGNLNSTTREVPVVFDPISGTWSHQLSRTNQQEREMGIEVARLTMEDQTFLAAVGFQQT